MSFLKVAWVLLTMTAGLRAIEVAPDRWYINAIPVGTLISSMCSTIVEEERRWPWKLKMPGKLRVFVAVILSAEWAREFASKYHDLDELSTMKDVVEFMKYINKHFSFWYLLVVKATDVSQVLLPMFLLVRPYHCLVLMIASVLLAPRSTM